MKKIINGKKYDTATAHECGTWSNAGSWRDFSHIEETLYRKRTGEFFLFGEGGPMTRFEKECEEGILRYLANLRMMYFGPELPVWYLTVEETNIVDVRMILTGLQAGIDPQRLRERLRETYV